MKEAHRSGRTCAFAVLSTDTRTLATDNLFFALVGPRFDGHDYVEQARAAGAAAAAVSRGVDTALPLLQVDDTRLALGRLAAHWRGRFAFPVIGVTGSNGKHRQDIWQPFLGTAGPVQATRGTSPRQRRAADAGRSGPEHIAPSLKWGANHPGEIAKLPTLARPTVASSRMPVRPSGRLRVDRRRGARQGRIVRRLADDAVVVITRRHLCRSVRGRQAPCAELSFGLTADGCERRLTSRTATLAAAADGGRRRRVDQPSPAPHRPHALARRRRAGGRRGTRRSPPRLETQAPVAAACSARAATTAASCWMTTYNANPCSAGRRITAREMPAPRWLVFGDIGSSAPRPPRCTPRRGPTHGPPASTRCIAC